MDYMFLSQLFLNIFFFFSQMNFVKYLVALIDKFQEENSSFQVHANT